MIFQDCANAQSCFLLLDKFFLTNKAKHGKIKAEESPTTKKSTLPSSFKY